MLTPFGNTLLERLSLPLSLCLSLCYPPLFLSPSLLPLETPSAQPARSRVAMAKARMAQVCVLLSLSQKVECCVCVCFK